jgi:large subunit ribosomal protein L35
MPKLKTKQKAAKRFRITKNGKVLAKASGRRHLLSSKNRKAKRQMKNAVAIDQSMVTNIRRIMPYA